MKPFKPSHFKNKTYNKNWGSKMFRNNRSHVNIEIQNLQVFKESNVVLQGNLGCQFQKRYVFTIFDDICLG